MLLRILTVLYGLKSFYTGSWSVSNQNISCYNISKCQEVEIFEKVLYSVMGAFCVS
jgi:hypothetical protein